jgi:hypothetical protein
MLAAVVLKAQMVQIRCFLVLHQQAVDVETVLAKMLVLLVDQVAAA